MKLSMLPALVGLLFVSPLFSDISLTPPIYLVEEQVVEFTLRAEDEPYELLVLTSTDWNLDPADREDSPFLQIVHKDQQKKCKFGYGDLDPEDVVDQEGFIETIVEVKERIYADHTFYDEKVVYLPEAAFMRSTFQAVDATGKPLHACISLYVVDRTLFMALFENTVEEVSVEEVDFMNSNMFLRKAEATS